MIARTPPRGWNSWNTFGGEINEAVVRETADAFIAAGLKDAGYEYVVIDDIWEADERVNGKLTWDAKKFPAGIPALAEYVHSKGLKFGIYSCAGTHTCAGKPASYGYEEEDARSFASWGVDFLKYDYCYAPPGANGPTQYQRMGQALRATGRPILFSICEWGMNEPWKWGARVGGHMWRTTGDISDSWDSIVDIGFQRQADLHPYAGPGRWNDPDMLVVGMFGKGNVAAGGCGEAEYRSHFSLWCLLAAPLMMGCDVRKMNDFTQGLLTNRGLLAVNQDPLGRQGWRPGWNGHAGDRQETWTKPLADGSVAVGLFNLSGKNTHRINVSWESMGLHDRRVALVTDVPTGKEIGEFSRSFSAKVGPHDCVVLRVAPRQ